MATAEWQRSRDEIIRAEQPEDGDHQPLVFRTSKEEQEHYVFMQDKSDYESSGLSSKISFDQWKQFREYQAWQASKIQLRQAPATEGPPMLPNACGSKPLKELSAAFVAHLEHRRKNTTPGLRSKEDLSESRLHQYKIALEHFDLKVGQTPVVPVGEFHVGEKQVSEVLGRYRQLCRDERNDMEFTGHWFNERMKTARAFIGFLADNRLLSNVPPNLAALVEKFKIEPNPKPIPLAILRALWTAADPEFQGFMLLALNCGFRQSEIHSLDSSHLRVVSGQTCVVKLRGKTGVPLTLPLWDSTHRFMEKYANKQGKCFHWQDSKKAIAVLHYKFKVLRERVGKKMPSATEYSFEHFRDTGASFIDGRNPALTPLYLGQGDTRQAKQYVAAINDEHGNPVMPMHVDSVMASFKEYLKLPDYEP